MLEIAIELAAHDASYTDMAAKFIEHFLWIARGMNRLGPNGMWDEEDGFYYDVLREPDGTARRLKVRSMVGLLPLCATTIIEPWQRERVPEAVADLLDNLRRRPDLLADVHPTGPGHYGAGGRGIAALVNPDRLRRILSRVLDENEFLSPYGIRAVSRYHAEHPYVLNVGGQEYRVNYLPAESDTGMFGGNSNWRGPISMPVNALLIRALLSFYLYHGDNFRIECPTRSGNFKAVASPDELSPGTEEPKEAILKYSPKIISCMIALSDLFEVAREIANRLTRIFPRDASGRRPVYGGTQKFQTDPHWKDYVLFYEYFHGDNGAGLGASHQTGWTGIVAKLIDMFGRLDAEQFLGDGRERAFSDRKAA